MIFGFFKKETPEQKAAQKAAKDRQEASIAAIERGELPLTAQERLKQFKAAGKLFTSDLSCNEMLLVKEAGYEPLSQVMGSAFVNVSMVAGLIAGWQTGELTDRTNALIMARKLAVARLQKEAQMLGAHGVIGIDLQVKGHSWAAGLIECTAIGTAIRIPGRAEGGTPFTSDLSGQDFWQLYEGGHWPLTLVLGISCYYARTDNQTQYQLKNFWGGNATNNQEINLYTQSFHNAYNSALNRLAFQANEVQAEGVVGMAVNHELTGIDRGGSESNPNHDVLITVTAVGTAIKADDAPRKERQYQPLIVMNVNDGRFSSLNNLTNMNNVNARIPEELRQKLQAAGINIDIDLDDDE